MSEINFNLRQGADAFLVTARERTRPGELPGSEQDLPSAISPPIAVAGSERAAASRLHVELSVHGKLEEVEQEWRAFQSEADHAVFQSFSWLAAWQRHIGARRDTRPAVVLGRAVGGRLLFVLPLAIEPRGAVRRLTWLGSDLCDYNAPLLGKRFSDHVSSDRFAELWREIIELLRANPRLRFDLIDLQKMPEAIGGQRNPFLNLLTRANPSGAYVATLGDDWNEFYAARRSAATRKRERRQLKHLVEHGDVRFVDVGGRAEIAASLDTLISQKARAFARMGVDNMFARPGYPEFYLAVATDPSANDLIQVSRLEVGSMTVAASVGLRFRDCYYLVLSSYDSGELSRFGPGRAHLRELMRHAIECGFQRFDFTIGDEPYKRDWSDIEVSLHDHLSAVTVRGLLALATTRTFRRAKRSIKQSPAMWHAFSKARALVAQIRPF